MGIQWLLFLDGFVKRPPAALHGILCHCGVREIPPHPEESAHLYIRRFLLYRPVFVF